MRPDELSKQFVMQIAIPRSNRASELENRQLVDASDKTWYNYSALLFHYFCVLPC